MENERKIPANELDLAYMTTESAWGREVTEELNKGINSIIQDIKNGGIKMEEKKPKGRPKKESKWLLSLSCLFPKIRFNAGAHYCSY